MGQHWVNEGSHPLMCLLIWRAEFPNGRVAVVVCPAGYGGHRHACT